MGVQIYDVVVAGGGLAGLSAAEAVRQGPESELSRTCCGSTPTFWCSGAYSSLPERWETGSVARAFVNWRGPISP